MYGYVGLCMAMHRQPKRTICGFGLERRCMTFADCRLQTADCRLQTADCRPQTADCYLRDTNCKIIHIENIRIKVTSSSIKQRQKKIGNQPWPGALGTRLIFPA